MKRQLKSSCCGAKILDEWQCAKCGELCHGEEPDYNDDIDRLLYDFDPIADRLDNREEILFEREHHLNF
jgi:hypothetical protein